MRAGRYVGRFAPSPTGPLHFGSLVCAVASWLDARAAGGTWLVRIEDIDPPREKPGAADDILRTLERYGLQWDGTVLYQSRRLAHYAAALDSLVRFGFAFRCSLSRAQLEPFGGQHPGRAFSRSHFDEAQGYSWRFDTVDAEVRFQDRIQGACSFNPAREGGPFVIRRRDGLPAYQLAVVVDDAAQGVTHVVRGSDLLDSTPRQILLQRALELAEPAWAHIPVITDERGEKLSKQQHAAAVTPDRCLDNLRLALLALGQAPDPDALTPGDLLAAATAAWRIDAVPGQAGIPLARLLN